MVRGHVLVCGGTGCHSANSDDIYDAFEKEIEAAGLKDEIQVIKTGCFGLCGFWVTITFRCAAPPPFWQTEF